MLVRGLKGDVLKTQRTVLKTGTTKKQVFIRRLAVKK